jgi:hypothetical protein
MNARGSLGEGYPAAGDHPERTATSAHDDKQSDLMTEPRPRPTPGTAEWDALFTLADVVRAIEDISRLDDTNEKLEAIEEDTDGIYVELRRIATSLEEIAKPRPPVGFHAIVSGRTNKADALSMFDYGEVVAFYPETNTLWLRDALGSVLDCRLHGPDDDDDFAYEVGPVSYFEVERDFIEALHAQRERDARVASEHFAAKKRSA